MISSSFPSLGIVCGGGLVLLRSVDSIKDMWVRRVSLPIRMVDLYVPLQDLFCISRVKIPPGAERAARKREHNVWLSIDEVDVSAPRFPLKDATQMFSAEQHRDVVKSGERSNHVSAVVLTSHLEDIG